MDFQGPGLARSSGYDWGDRVWSTILCGCGTLLLSDAVTVTVPLIVL